MSSADELIKTIAAKNGIIVKEDDPIMVLHTANNTLLAEAEARLKKQQVELLTSFQAALDEISVKWTEETKEQAEHVLNTTLQASKKAMLNTMNEGTEKMSVAMKEQIGRFLVETNKAEPSKFDLYSRYAVIFSVGIAIGCLIELLAIKGIPFIN